MQPHSHNSLEISRPLWTIRISAAGLVLFFVWASVASLDRIVKGPGNVVPSTNAQVIQSLEGGILSELLVWEGKIVEQGEVLARLSDARFNGSFRELESEVTALKIRLFRLEKEQSFAEDLKLPKSFWDKDRNVAESEKQFFEARRSEYLSSRSALTTALTLSEQKVSMLSRLVRDQLAPELDLINARQALGEAEANLNTLESDYRTSRSQEYAETLTELKKLEAALDVRADQLDRTVLTSPTRAIVNEIMVTTIGGVAPPGEPILELTPLDDDLRIEAKISPKDVAFVRPGMLATIKLTAFDYTIYGSLKGKVLHVSSDTFEDETQRDRPPYYKVLVSVSAEAIDNAHDDITIRPGMIAESELHVGSRTVLQYLLKPIFKASNTAFREP